jgi:hypothetical protein
MSEPSVSGIHYDHVDLPNGCWLYWKPNAAGGRTYYTDECSVGHEVWDTCLTGASTLIAALHQENILRIKEYHEAKSNKKGR